MPVPSLPNEVFANILDHLDYRDLLVMTMVNRDLRSIVADKRYQRQLFRSDIGLDSTSRKLTPDFRRHPIFTAHQFACGSHMNCNDLALRLGRSTYCLISTTSTPYEYAGSPPPTHITVRHSGVSVYVQNECGLVVDWVTHAMCAAILRKYIQLYPLAGYAKSSFATDAEVDSLFQLVPKLPGMFRWKVLAYPCPRQGLGLDVHLLEWPGDETGVGECLDLWTA